MLKMFRTALSALVLASIALQPVAAQTFPARVAAVLTKPTPAISITTNITLAADVWAFGASSMAGSQSATNAAGGSATEDMLTDTVRAIEGLGSGSSAYTTVSGSQLTRPIDYNLTGANSTHKIRNRGVGSQTSGSAGSIVSTMSTASASFGASDFYFAHQGDNGITGSSANAPEILSGGYASMRALMPSGTIAAGRFVELINTQAGYNSNTLVYSELTGSWRGYADAAALRIQRDLYPGRAISLYDTMMDRASPADSNDTADIAVGSPPRSYMVNDGSHQWGKGYNGQSSWWVTPMIDAWAGGTPFPLKQILEAVTPSTPASGDTIGTIVAYGSGGTFALDSSNTGSGYAISSSGVVTRTSATLPTRDITWLAVKTSKSGRLDKVQPKIGVAERAASGVSKLVNFDGYSVLGAPDSKLANSAKVTILFRIQATDAVASTNAVFGSQGTTAFNVVLTQAGNLNALVKTSSTATALSKNTTGARFTTASAVRWVAICIDLSDPAAEVTKLVDWAVPATATETSAGAHSTLTADNTTAWLARLDLPIAIGATTAAGSVSTTFGKFAIGDFTIWRDYIDFTVQARRDEVSDSAGAPISSWVSGGGVVNGKTPDIRIAGNAADFRQGRITGSSAPASPGASGQFFGFAARMRADAEFGYLTTLP